ncbi:hypothetical protein N9242_00920 [Vicingaceae bacterium]|nr:hypothetical protein [Vicingaceae bacterium]
MAAITKYSNYYTSADTFLTVESSAGGTPILLDKMETIAFGESSSARAVYGIGQPVFGFTNVGNLIVSGQLLLRFTDEDYLLYAIKTALGESINYVPDNQSSRDKFNRAQTVADANQIKDDIAISRNLDSSRLYSLPQSFNMRLTFDNDNLYNETTPKTLLIKDVRILSSEIVSGVSQTGPVNIKYSFIARMVS